MSVLNPNHPAAQAAEGQWHKLCAILMYKMGYTDISLSHEDIQRLQTSGISNIVIRYTDEDVQLLLVSDAEALRIAKQESGEYDA